MLKWTVKYTDFNDVEQTEDLYFNLTESELIELEAGTEGGFSNKLKSLENAKDSMEILKIFKQIVLLAYGIKSEDGKKFRKNSQIVEDFLSSSAYDALFSELITDDKKASAFVNGIIPAKLRQK